MIIDNKGEHHWRMVFEENYGGADNEKLIVHAKRWDVYTKKKKRLLRVVILGSIDGNYPLSITTK